VLTIFGGGLKPTGAGGIAKAYCLTGTRASAMVSLLSMKKIRGEVHTQVVTEIVNDALGITKRVAPANGGLGSASLKNEHPADDMGGTADRDPGGASKAITARTATRRLCRQNHSRASLWRLGGTS